MARHALSAGLWILAFAVAWFAWAWLTFGFLPIAVLVAALALDDRRRKTTSAATGVAAALLAALLVGYNPDWLVVAGLGAALALKLRASGSAAASPGDTASSS